MYNPVMDIEKPRNDTIEIHENEIYTGNCFNGKQSSKEAADLERRQSGPAFLGSGTPSTSSNIWADALS